MYRNLNKGLTPEQRKKAAGESFVKTLRHMGWEFDDGDCPACIADLIAEGLRRLPAGKRGTFELDAEIIAQDFAMLAREIDSTTYQED